MTRKLKYVAVYVLLVASILAVNVGRVAYTNTNMRREWKISTEKVKEGLKKAGVNSESDFEWDGNAIVKLRDSYKGKYIVIPDKCTEIKASAFKDREIEAVFTGNNVEIIGIMAFENCYHLKYVEMSDSVKILRGGVFSGCAMLKEVKLSDNISTIMNFTFESCNSLKTINKPTKLEEVGISAFGDEVDINSESPDVNRIRAFEVEAFSY